MNQELRVENKKIRSFTDLVTWQEAHKLVIMIYKVTKQFPKEEQFGLTNQIRRAVVSITSNIAEGFSRISVKEKLNFYHIALGSLTEVQSQLFVAKDVSFMSQKDFNMTADQALLVSRVCNGLIKKSKTFLNS